jgi:anti-sigma-K factor RskA
MSVHEQFAEDLSLYALGALEGEERLALEKHLAGCAACGRELEDLRASAALLAFSVSGPKPPARARARLMAAVAKEPRRMPVRTVAYRTWWRPLEWALGAAAMLVVVLLLRQNGDLRQRVSDLELSFANQERRVAQAEQLVSSLASPDAEQFTLVAGKTPPQPQGKAIYVRNGGTLVFIASNMPQLPPQKAYELWLIPVNGAPIPAGVFKPDAHGSATVVRPPLPAGMEAKTFAITIEPEAGSAAPTSQPIMVGVQG